EASLNAQKRIVEAYVEWVDHQQPPPSCFKPRPVKKTGQPVEGMMQPVPVSARHEAERMLKCLASRPAYADAAHTLGQRLEAQKLAEAKACTAQNLKAFDGNTFGLLGALKQDDACDESGVLALGGP